ncbi:MAG: hypothetical protein WA624_01565 [Methylocella sp.]
MLHFSRCASIIGAPLTLAALLACVAPAGAKISTNGTSLNGTSLNTLAANGVTQSGVPASARITNGPALGDLNGVAVEAVVIPEAALR